MSKEGHVHVNVHPILMSDYSIIMKLRYMDIYVHLIVHV